MNWSASARGTPAFCVSSPTFTCTSRLGERPSSWRRRDDRVGQARPVEALDHVGQPHRVARLVGLQPADQVQSHIRVGVPQLRELARGFLDPVLAEMALPGGQRGLDRLGGVGLGDGDQRDRVGRAARAGRGRRDPFLDPAQAFDEAVIGGGGLHG